MLCSTSVIGFIILNLGQLVLSDYIVGGSNASIAEYPHQIALLFQGTIVCGGSLIAEDLVLTAAHCTHDKGPQPISIRAGSDSDKSGGEVVAAKELFVHPKYDTETVDYDVSVVRLAKKVTLGPKTKLIKIAAVNSPVPIGAVASVTGWGYLKENGDKAETLQVVQVPRISNKDCAAKYSDNPITSRMMCFGYETGGKDACQGDSGGPLLWNDIQVGVVSWGYGCARANQPGIYTSLPDPEINEFVTKHLNSKK